ncbi:MULTISPECIES: DUF7489 domain-containing protein [unclassified Streptomyces]|uniref:DUF7489 domain-containing protein n=1 Tax=unclassified Streptomyces TaxID=2593676 RepID=UPI00035D0698|nr:MULTISPECIES: hypothetical protein [unclassified Streptomyces]EYT79517.1 hypothetical protein CF54_30845 [Streptomyces sp. Tu 6176]
MVKSRKVQEEDAWDGVVADKTRRSTDGSGLYHYVEVRLSGGGTGRFRVDKALWETLSVGDRLVKEAGAAAPARA